MKKAISILLLCALMVGLCVGMSGFVTVLFALMEISVLTIIISNFSIGVLVLFLLIMVLLVPYVMHYYLLENSVQYMYEQYDRINELAGILAFK